MFVDWAQRRNQADESILESSQTIFINYLSKDMTPEIIEKHLSVHGNIENVTKIKDYAFVLFDSHQGAVDALNGIDKNVFGGDTIEVSLALPKTMKKPKPRRFNPTKYHYQQKNYQRNHAFGVSYNFPMRKRYNSGNVN